MSEGEKALDELLISLGITPVGMERFQHYKNMFLECIEVYKKEMTNQIADTILRSMHNDEYYFEQKKFVEYLHSLKKKL